MNSLWRRSLRTCATFFILTAVVGWHEKAWATSLSLTWADNSTNEDGFKVERKTGISGTFTQVAMVGANTISYIDAGATAGTTYCYRVRAYNTAGDSAYSNEACGAAAADTQAPTVSITAPANGATVSGTSVTVSASASDNVGVVGVQFLLNGANLGSEDTTAPYAIAWNSTTVPNGTHTIAAVARDAAGNKTTSSAVTVTVSNEVPSSGQTVASINFQPSSAPVPTGYQKDDGSVYSATRGYGWDQPVGTRDRDVNADQRLDTFTFVWAGSAATWNYTLPSGTYLVSLASGDPGYSQGPHRVEVEGNVVVNNTSTASNTYVTITDFPVVVSDGQLSVKIGDATAGNSMLNYLIIKTSPVTPLLTVTKTGSGSGTVSSNPAGISCGADCSEPYASGTAVTLTATPAAGSTFSGWSGPCSGTSSCTVTMTATTSVTATFATSAPQSYTLTVAKAGTGSGTVSSSPAGISCGADCSEPYASGTAVTLTATPAAGSTFTGWSGACSGTGTCTVSVSANTSVTATFAPQMNAKIGIFRPSTGEWFLDLNGNGVLDDCTVDACVKSFGQQGNLPVVGDWTGSGTAQIGIFEPKTRLWKLDRNGNDRWDDCTVDLCLGPFINSVDLPVVGRWKAGASTDMIGIYRPSKRLWRLDFDGNGKMDACTVDGCYGNFGQSTDLPVVGDWTGSGTTKIGVFEPNTGLWKLDKNGNGKLDSCTVDSCMGPFGISGDRPVTGDWTGDGKRQIGVFDPSTGMWELDLNGNGVFDGCAVDACLGPFGQQGDLPVVGKW